MIERIIGSFKLGDVMKKCWFFLPILVGIVLYFTPFQQSITFTETRTEQPSRYFVPLKGEDEFQLIFTHSIHLTDVIESYKVLSTNELQLLSMEYSDVAIGMPSYAEQGQTLQYENGVYTLRYEDAKIKEFTLHIGDVDYKLNVFYKGEIISLKEQLTRGKSYVVQVQNLSFYQKMKGVQLYE